ncbi:MAG: hypothetical protein MJK12_13440 [Colwellia sp.]|nr:hypothetical protein [Colwellia sp.]
MKSSIKIITILLVFIPWQSMANSHQPAHTSAENWIIKNKANNFSYNTLTQRMTSRDHHQKGLISLARKGSIVLKNYWQEGAYRSTVTFNNAIIIDGFDINDVSRITSFRFDKKGSFVYLRTTKGPKSTVILIENNKEVMFWPRLSKIKIITLQKDYLILSMFDENSQSTSFLKYKRSAKGVVTTNYQVLGKLEGCSILTAKDSLAGILIQSYCQADQGSDVQLLNKKTHQIIAIKTTHQDEILASFMMNKADKKKKDNIAILTVSGSTSALHLYHAISGSLLKLLGEPMSLASDEAGKQSWSQSYRTLTLAELYWKTNHPVFSTLAVQAMWSTLRQQNQYIGINRTHNPSCAWASRIYSTDSVTPISFLINQAMISNSLINSCKKIDKYCPSDLKSRIRNNAICLVKSYEYLFIENQGLYRIPYASSFRYDGIWAPWNWHITWAAVLRYVASETNDIKLDQRAIKIINSFIRTWEFTEEPEPKSLWHYWPMQYYQGWRVEDKISTHRPKQAYRPLASQRYEDLNHAGISLLGLYFSNYQLDKPIKTSISNTINSALTYGSLLPRDMNGDGPKNPRWSLAAGWHDYATMELINRYTHQLPSYASTSKHLAYALLSKKAAEFNLQLSLSICTESGCRDDKVWSWDNISDFLNNNPLFSLSEISH